MKILHAVPAFHPEGPGGIEVYTRALVAAQRERGHEPVVLTGCAEVAERPSCERDEVDGTPVWRLHRTDLFSIHHAKAYDPGVEELVEDLLAREQPDVLHVHHWLRLTCNLVELARRAGVAVVVTLHDVYPSCPRCWRVDHEHRSCDRELGVVSCVPCVPRWGCESAAEVERGVELFRQAYRHELTAAHAVLAVSGVTGNFVAQKTGLTGLDVLELPPSYSPRTTAAHEPGASPRPMPGPEEPFRFAHWGNLGRHKGTDVLLRAVRALIDGGAPRRFELHVFGEPESAAYAAELREIAVGMPIVWHGRFEFTDLQRAAPHIGVMPSLAWETFSFALEECFELGLPCIVSAVGALPERVGGAGIVVAPGDAAELSRAMAQVLTDPALRDRLARLRPDRAMTAGEHAAALERVYERIVGSPPPADPTPAVPLRDWTRYFAMQRDSAQARSCPPADGRA